MVPLSMTLSDLWPGFQGYDIFWSRISEKMALFKDKVTIAQQETIPNIRNGTMFGDLDWALNASRGFVSISWASCPLFQLKLICLKMDSLWEVIVCSFHSNYVAFRYKSEVTSDLQEATEYHVACRCFRSIFVSCNCYAVTYFKPTFQILPTCICVIL